MAVLIFYWPNLIAAAIIVFVLGMVGKHLVARNQSMEIMLLGQEFQTSILISALFLSFFEQGEHGDHGYHLELILTLSFVLFFHLTYLLILKKYRNFRIEGAITLIVVLTGISHLAVLASPLVEMHMVKSYLGDIVTISKHESVFIAITTLTFYFIFLRYQKIFYKETIEIALFGKTTQKRKKGYLFSFITLALMLLSIHLFGSLFTVGALIIPSFIASVMNVNKKHYLIMTFLNSLSVLLAFMFLTTFERLPTTVLILIFILCSSIIYSVYFKKIVN